MRLSDRPIVMVGIQNAASGLTFHHSMIDDAIANSPSAIKGSFIGVGLHEDKHAIHCTNLRVHDDVLLCDVEILHTPYGLNVIRMLYEGHPLALELLGPGSINDEGEVHMDMISAINVAMA